MAVEALLTHRRVATHLIRRHPILHNQILVTEATKDSKDRQDTVIRQLQFFHHMVIPSQEIIISN